MMKFGHPLYFCTECKKVVEKIDELQFIEEQSSKGFCSEQCIEDFYAPLILHFESLEIKHRKLLGIEHETIFQQKDDKSLIEEALSFPSEVWQLQNELGDSFYHYLRHHEDYSIIVICTLYHGQASFVFFKTVTRSREFLAEFRPIKNENESLEENHPSEELDEGMSSELGKEMTEEDFLFMQELENKKSKLLADLLVKRKDDDISFEAFSEYEYCFQDCLDSPDEVFENKDNEGDTLFTYIKSFIKDSQNYFYIITCLKKKSLEDGLAVNVFPVLAFPTNDMDLYLEFRAAIRISGPLKN